MRVVAGAHSPCALILLLLAGCTQNPYMLQRQVQTLQQQQVAQSQQSQELLSRANLLDKDNQELQTLLAQERQRNQLYADQLTALRDQLGGATSQIARLQDSQSEAERKSQTLSASVRRRAGATITPNNSLLESLPAINLPGVQVRRDEDLIRIEVAANQLFEEGTAQFKPQAAQVLQAVTEEVLRTYPNQVLGIEGHTDSQPPTAGQWPGNHQLSIGQAMAVYDYLTTLSRLQANQLLIAGHGPNRPVVSNATPAGRERNRRIEIVIYPEKVGSSQ